MPTSQQLHDLRTAAYSFLLDADRPLPAQAVAGRLFGDQRHEDPVASIVVRHLLQDDPRFLRTHAGRWCAADAPLLARPLDEILFTVVDLETTGSVLGVDEVVEIGALAVRGGVIEKRLSTLVRSRQPLPPWIRRLTGIRTSDLRTAPTFPEVAPQLHEMLVGAVFVAHDLRFDLPFLRWEFSRHGLEMPELVGVCTLQLSRLIWPELPSRRLADLARLLDVPHNQPHRAGADAEATAGILQLALERARELGLRALGDLFAVAVDGVVVADSGDAADGAPAPLAAEATG